MAYSRNLSRVLSPAEEEKLYKVAMINDSTEEDCLDYGCWSDSRFAEEVNNFIFPNFYGWIFVLLFVVVFLFGVIGNFLVCYVVWKNNHMKSVTNFFLVNLACADFTVNLVCLPPTLIHDIAQTWFLGEYMCKAILYLQVSECLYMVMWMLQW